MKNKKVVLITGAAGGIGRALAVRFFREGYSLVLSDINYDGLESLEIELDKVAQSGSEYVLLTNDLASGMHMDTIVNECRNRWNRLDVLVNNAVWRKHDTMRTISESDWDKTVQVSLTAPAFLAKYSAELMEETGFGGTIINISSVMATSAGGTSPAYVACKGAMESLTYELATLYGPSGIRVVGIAPGNVLTPGSDDFLDPSGKNISDRMKAYMEDQTPLQRSAQPAEIANVAYWLTTAEASFVNGTIIEADGGFRHAFGSYGLKKIQFPDQF